MTGLVLAGGRSSRFGSDKSHVVLHGAGNMLAWSCALLASLPGISRVALSCRPDQVEELHGAASLLIPDESSGTPSPLRGLVAALKRTGEPVFAIPCDLPLMTADILSLLIRARQSRLEAPSGPVPLLRTTFIDSDGFLESLIGIYEKESLPFLEDALAHERWGVWSAIPAGGNCLVPRPESPAFLNMNTPEDFEYALSLLKDGERDTR